MVNLKGQKFGRLIAIEALAKREFRGVVWLCKCDCGSYVEVVSNKLRQGNTKSCGCLNKERVIEVNKIHGHAANKMKTPTYSTWGALKSRCNNPNDKRYDYYGGRGITVCKRWLRSFENFLEDMGERPKDSTIDRIENDGGYEPDNCRWATREKQIRNSRQAKLNPLKVQVIKKLLKESNLMVKEIAEIFHVGPGTISNIKAEKTWADINY